MGIPFLGPLIVFLVVKDRGPVRAVPRRAGAQLPDHHHDRAAGSSGSLSFVLIGIPFLIATAIAWVVLSIVAAIKANNGEWYRYPLTPGTSVK